MGKNLIVIELHENMFFLKQEFILSFQDLHITNVRLSTNYSNDLFYFNSLHCFQSQNRIWVLNSLKPKTSLICFARNLAQVSLSITKQTLILMGFRLY